MKNPDFVAVVGEIVPELYASRGLLSGRPASSDMSRSHLCSELTLDLWSALNARGWPVRRELHIDAYDQWHYVVAHVAEGAAQAGGGAPPTDTDEIIDLNPWRPEPASWRTGYLHGPRNEVMDALRDAGVAEEFVALRSVATVVSAHTLEQHLQPQLRPAS